MAGKISGIRFYKGPQNLGGSHRSPVELSWEPPGQCHPLRGNGERLAAGQFRDSGLDSGQHGLRGLLPRSARLLLADGNYFAAAHVNGTLTAPASTGAGGNGVYAYQATSKFPNSTFSASNYWLDVVFTT